MIAREVAARAAPAGDRVDDAADELPDAGLALGRAERPAEVLLRDDVRGVLRPGRGELDVALLEGVAALLVVRDDRIATLPLDLVVRVDALGREVPLELEAVPDHPDAVLLGRPVRCPLPARPGGEGSGRDDRDWDLGPRGPRRQ